jgi:putative SOS response-associated peptidase YedK
VRYKVCSTATIDAIVERHTKHELVRMRWGRVPSWWSKPLKERRSTRGRMAAFDLLKPRGMLNDSRRGNQK